MVYDWGMVDSPDVRVVLDELTAVRQRFDRLAGDAYSLGQSLGNLERRLWGDPHEQAVLAELLHEIRRRLGGGRRAPSPRARAAGGGAADGRRATRRSTGGASPCRYGHGGGIQPHGEEHRGRPYGVEPALSRFGRSVLI